MRYLFFFLLLPFGVKAQNTIGLPDIINYNKQVFKGGLQTWDIKQDKNGIIYAANNEGLLSFDGINWSLFPLPNKTIVRSVEILGNRIYVGGQDEVGYFSPSANGSLQYVSLINKLPEKARSFGDVWDIVSFEDNIFIRTNSRIFRLKNDNISVYPAPAEWAYLGVCNSVVYAQDYQNGLLKFDNGNWQPIASAILPKDDPVTAILPLKNDTCLLATLKTGLFIATIKGVEKFSNTHDAVFRAERIYSGISLGDKSLGLATSNHGFYVLDKSLHIIQSFSRAEGLQNNNVLSAYYDRQGNIWLGLDNGIDFIGYSSAIKQVNPASQDGSGYAVAIYDNKIYMGTSSGLYSSALQQVPDLSFSMGSFLPVENAKGQVWKLAVINNEVLMGHHEGAFVVKNNRAEKISSKMGFWDFLPLTHILPAQQIIAGNYKGIDFYDYTNGSFKEAGSVSGFSESSRYIAVDNDGAYWVSHPYHGVFRIVKNEYNSFSTNMYTDKNGLPSLLNNHVYKIKNEIVVATEKGVYRYNTQKDAFEPHPLYQSTLDTMSVRYLRDDPSGNIWFIHEKMLGIIDYSGKEPVVVYLPELSRKMLSGFEFIYPVNAQNTFLAGEKGFFHINYDKYKKSNPLPVVQIRKVKISAAADSLLFGGYFGNIGGEQLQQKGKIPSIAQSWKTIRFEFSSAVFGNQANAEYSYRLKNFDATWSEWSARSEKEYTNLPHGEYTFEVKVRSSFGRESEAASYTFRVLPNWYQTIAAKMIYLLLFAGLLYAAYLWQQRKLQYQQAKHNEEQQRLRYIHELEINKSESELVALKNDKLETEISFKNSELASSAMHLLKKGELINRLRNELNHVAKKIENTQAVAEIKKLVKTLGEDERSDEDWQLFAQHFDKVHSDFTKRLKEKVPTITASEMKLCAYLRMNLSTKEIAQLLNISVRGVEISRYRLRKKLDIPTEVNLFDYLMGV